MARARTRRQNTRDDVANALMSLPNNFIECRDMRHAWAVDEDFFVAEVNTRNNISEVHRVLGCMRCGTQRLERYIPTKAGGLEKVKQGYFYSEGYQLSNVPRGVKPHDILHAEQYRRAMEKLTEQQKKQKQKVS